MGGRGRPVQSGKPRQPRRDAGLLVRADRAPVRQGRQRVLGYGNEHRHDAHPYPPAPAAGVRAHPQGHFRQHPQCRLPPGRRRAHHPRLQSRFRQNVRAPAGKRTARARHPRSVPARGARAVRFPAAGLHRLFRRDEHQGRRHAPARGHPFRLGHDRKPPRPHPLRHRRHRTHRDGTEIHSGRKDGDARRNGDRGGP